MSQLTPCDILQEELVSCLRLDITQHPDHIRVLLLFVLRYVTV